MKLCRSQISSFWLISSVLRALIIKAFSLMCIFLRPKPAVKIYSKGQTGGEKSPFALTRSKKIDPFFLLKNPVPLDHRQKKK